MSINFRKTLFLTCVVLFLIFAPVIIFYSQGYRIDWNPTSGRMKVTQTGGLFFRISPKQAEIFLDSKLKKTTDFFFSSALIENLIPKKYSILIRKQGYHSWEKSLEVKEKTVTAAENIILIPLDVGLTSLAADVENFWLSPDNRTLVIQEKTLINQKQSWSLKLFNIQKKIKSHLIEEADIYTKGADLISVEFSADSKKILLKVGMKEQEKKFILEIDKVPPILTEVIEKTFSLKNIVTYQEFGEEVYYLDDRGYLSKADSNFEQQTRINEIPINVLSETEYEIKRLGELIFLRENEKLYLFNKESRSLEGFFEPIANLKLSPDSKKIVYFSNYEIWVFFLENTQNQPFKRAGEKVFLMRLSERIQDIAWLDSANLIISTENETGSKIRISEIDERDRINVAELTQLPNPEIIFNKADKKLYILSNNNIYQSKQLLP